MFTEVNWIRSLKRFVRAYFFKRDDCIDKDKKPSQTEHIKAYKIISLQSETSTKSNANSYIKEIKTDIDDKSSNNLCLYFVIIFLSYVC